MERREIGQYGRVKRYPDGTVELMAADRPLFGWSGWEEVGAHRIKSHKSNNEATPRAAASDPENIERAARRARAKLRDIALCTPFRYFVTLTLDREKVDRYDMAVITKKLNNWLDNQVRRHGLSYVLVPERHRDGAIHFHGFFNDALPVIDSGTLTNIPGRKRPGRPRSEAQRKTWLEAGARVVYNLPAWHLGFTTAIELYGEYSKAVAYVCKYIGKQTRAADPRGAAAEALPAGKVGGRWYYSGGDLGAPAVEYATLDVRAVAELPGSYTFSVPEAGASFAVWRGKENSCTENSGAETAPGGGAEP